MHKAIVPALVTFASLWAWHACGSDRKTTAAQGGGPDSCALFDHSHAAWTNLLGRYVRDGFVDYAGLKKDGQADLGAYLRSLESVCRGHYDTWTRERKLAYWINAYNAYTVRLILNHYPLASIRKIGLLPGAAFREDFIPLTGLRGKTLSLNDIEQEILRKDFSEPRIHFAIVCASKSCPTLRSEAYRAADLDRQLDEAARGFIRDSSKNRFDAASHKLYLSSIFKWFREDFERADSLRELVGVRGASEPRSGARAPRDQSTRAAKTLHEFVARYADEPTARAIRSGSVSIEFLDYDWSLNGR